MRRQGFGDLPQDAVIGITLGRPDQGLDGGKAFRTGQWRQTAFQQIALVRRQHQAGPFVGLLGHEFDIVSADHGYIPFFARWAMPAPIFARGRISSARPASATAPGMPQTTLVASSCARMVPPALRK